MPRPRTAPRRAIALTGALALCASRAAAQATPAGTAERDALVRALAPVLAARLRTHSREAVRLPRPVGDVWDVWAPDVAPAAAHALRDSVLAAVGGRPRTPADPRWTDVGVTKAYVAGDSAVVGVDLGARWCDATGYAPNGGGEAYDYVFRRTGAGWAFAHVADVFFSYSPAPKVDLAPAVPAAPAGGGAARRCGG